MGSSRPSGQGISTYRDDVLIYSPKKAMIDAAQDAYCMRKNKNTDADSGRLKPCLKKDMTHSEWYVAYGRYKRTNSWGRANGLPELALPQRLRDEAVRLGINL